MNKNKPDGFRLPECLECFSDIKEHSDRIIQGFEIRSQAVLMDFMDKTNTSVINANLKFASMGDEFTYFLSKAEEKHNGFYDKMEKRHNIMIMIEIFLFGLFGLGLAYLFMENNKKANVSDVFLWKDAKELQETGDIYRDDRYVVRPNSTSLNTYKYIWAFDRIFKIKDEKSN